MGGDYAPRAVVLGTELASKTSSSELILVGPQDVLESELAALAQRPSNVTIKNASGIPPAHESPVLALRKRKDASILVATRLIKEGTADAVVSAGSTGIGMVAARTILRLLPGVARPAIAALLPNPTGMCLVIDVGANVDCRPQHLYEFAVMGNIFARQVLNIPSPRVGLVNIGEEEGKGNQFSRAAFEVLAETNKAAFDFVGNIEGRDIYEGTVDVVVCDGFVGNVILKTSEALATAVFALLRRELTADPVSKLGAALSKKAFKRVLKRVDYEEYGGVPILGVDGVFIVCHGSSGPKAIANAVFEAERCVSHEVNRRIVAALADRGTASVLAPVAADA